MTQRTNGTVQLSNLSGSSQYTVYTKGFDLTATHDIRDISQKSFEVIVQSIGLRAMPLLLSYPAEVEDLYKAGADRLKGKGFIWAFGTEVEDAFYDSTLGDTGKLVTDIHGIVLPDKTVLKTFGHDQNIEFKYKGI